MSKSDSRPRRPRVDGWTADRQLRFLDVLTRTQNITHAAAAAGMSRESAYRLRARPSAALFAAAWGRAMKVTTPSTAAFTETPLHSDRFWHFVAKNGRVPHPLELTSRASTS